jgi:hypothetical protein
VSGDPSIPLLDHELAPDEFAWMKAVYDEFCAVRGSYAGQERPPNPKQVLREVVGRERHRLSAAADLSGPCPWRLGQNRHGRGVAVVFLSKVELHRHSKSRTDQFPIYVVGQADAFSIGDGAIPVLTPVTAGGHFHNPPSAPHAFLPRVGEPVPEDWEICFIAITPRNLREDTQAVSDDVRASYKRVVGTEAPLGV